MSDLTADNCRFTLDCRLSASAAKRRPAGLMSQGEFVLAAFERLRRAFSETLQIVAGKMSQIAETAFHRHLRHRTADPAVLEHVPGVLQADLFQERHRRLAAAGLEVIKNATRAGGGCPCETRYGYRFIPVGFDVLLGAAHLPRRRRSPSGLDQRPVPNIRHVVNGRQRAERLTAHSIVHRDPPHFMPRQCCCVSRGRLAKSSYLMK